MSVTVDHRAQLGVLETGLKSLKTDKKLMSEAEFSDMFWAVERHHRDLKLAHLTGKSKDLMVQAEKDTRFYNILIKMLCEVKRGPADKQRDSLKKVHLWYQGNRHTLATGPRFGKSSSKTDEEGFMRSISVLQSQTPSSRKKTHSATSLRDKSSKGSRTATSRGSNLKERKDAGDMKDARDNMTSIHDDTSSAQGYRESVHLISEPASSRMSMFGNDFMTSRFMMDLPSSKLSWHLESPNMAPTPDWDGTDIELHRVADSSLSYPVFDDHFHPSHPSVPNSSPRSGDNSPGSDVSGGSDGNVSSGVGGGSTDMIDFHQEMRRKLSRGQGSMTNGHQEAADSQSSAGGYGLQRKMVHSIASLVNPHAKMAETEAQRAEEEYRETISSQRAPSRAYSAYSSKGSRPDLSNHIPVLRAVSVTSNKTDNAAAFSGFRSDHLFGQDILSLSHMFRKSPAPVQMPPISAGRLNFVGRSGTALDVRYTAHSQADRPELHTNEVLQLYNLYRDNAKPSQVPRTESIMHNQTLEDFYQTAENYSPSPAPRFRASSRIQSAPAPRVQSTKTTRGGVTGAKTTQSQTQSAQKAKQTPRTQKLGKNLIQNGTSSTKEGGVQGPDEVLFTAGDRPVSAVKLDAVVNMIDHVKDEMNFFREKLAPTPMPGFRQPASTNVSNKPLSRPTSTASRKSRVSSASQRPRSARSPSPQGRPSTPMEAEGLVMGDPEVPSDTFRSNTGITRPHSATVHKAVDWRGKITPEAARIRSKSRFGGHTYVQKLKPSLRTAGATSAGNRPKTAPVNVQERWKTKNKDDSDSVSLPEVMIQNYPTLVTKTNDSLYPVKYGSSPLPIITEMECDKSPRVPQAASHSVTQIEDKDMDQMMNIKYILGSSDDRYGSMGSLFLDEDFLRSLNSRYMSGSSTTLATGGNQPREYVSIVGPTPRMSPVDSRSHSRQTLKKLDIQQIPEERSVKEESSEVGTETKDEDNTQDKENQSPNAEITESDKSKVLDTNVSPLDDLDDKVKDTARSESIKFDCDLDQSETETQRDIQVAVTALLPTATPEAPPASVAGHLEGLSQSEVWHYEPDVELKQVKSQTQYVKGSPRRDREVQQQHLQQNQHHHHHHHQHHGQHESSHWAKSIVKPENYCFHCLPDKMSTKVGRSAGRMPGGPQTHSGQVLRMARRQNEHYKNTPPTRTPPSIPSPHHAFGGRMPGQGQPQSQGQGQQFFSELEHHARKVNSPRHYMEQVVELRKDCCRSAPPGGARPDDMDLTGSLSVVSLRVPDRAQSAPLQDPSYPFQSMESIHIMTPHMEAVEPEEGAQSTDRQTDTQGETQQKDAEPQQETQKDVHADKEKGTRTVQSIAHVGRPIPQVSHIPDPDEEKGAVMKQKEAKAAVSIQRIFRGFVCRNTYRKLLWENRKNDEDKQMLAQDNQRELRKHQSRKARIYSRPPLDPALLNWAQDFKAIQTEKQAKRAVKMDNMQKEMISNQQKAKSKLEMIGPHVEIYDIYHPKETGPSKRDMHKAAVKMQAQVRGFLVRRRFEKLHRKATFCGTTWKKIVKDYRNLLIRVQHWHGVEKASAPFCLPQMYEYMDVRRRYESQFDKKSFGEELELGDLESFFRECDLYPSKLEIDEGLDVITQGQILKKGRGLKKQEAMNLLFYIYVPPATGLEDTRQSTWMNPIINGVEAKKLIGNEFVEGAPLAPCADLVIKSRRDRRIQEEKEKEREREEKRKQRGSVSSEESEGEKRSKMKQDARAKAGTLSVRK